jgi:hypothetical protein
MKKTIFTVLALFTATVMVSQDVRFNEGDKVLNLGIGFGSNFYYPYSSYSTIIPAVSASLEVGFMDDLLEVENLNLGLGGYVGFKSYRRFDHDYTSLIVGGRAALHYPLVDKLDTYSGLLLGFNLDSYSNRIAYSWFLGGRYYFTDNIAGMVELGYGIAYLNLGVALRIPTKGE